MTRTLRRALLLAAACTLAVSAFSGTATAKKPPRDFFGVVVQEPPSGGDFSSMAAGNVGSMRISFHFEAVQQVDGRCQAEVQVGICSWTVLDGIVGRASAAGVRVLPTLTADKPPLKGERKREWKDFLTAAARRYGPGGFFWQPGGYGGQGIPITDWQVYNEPNSKQFWPGRPNPREYARLLKASAKAIRKEHRKADIVLAGMFGDAKVPLVQYLRDLYRVKRVERFFSSIALHPYAPRIGGLKRQIRETRRTAKRGGDGKVGLRLTELGWSSDRGPHPLMKGKKGQAKLLTKSFKLLKRRRGRWNIDGISWYALRDSRNEALCTFCNKAGLLNNSGKPKPAFRAFRRVAK